MFEFLPSIYYSLGFILIFWYLVKYNCNNMSKYIVAIWIVSSIYALIVHVLISGNYSKISFLPYIYLHICFLVSLYPVVKFDYFKEKKLENIYIKPYQILLYGFILVSIIPFIENLMYVLQTYSSGNAGLADVYSDKMEIGFDSQKVVTWLSPLGRLGNSIDGVFIDFLIFSLFFFLTIRSVSNIFLFALVIPVANHILYQFAMAGRGVAAFFILLCVFFYFYFQRFIPKERVSYIIKLGTVFVGGLIIALSILSYARKEETNAGADDLLFFGYYLGKGHLDFNEDLWYIKKTTEGDNSFSYVKAFVGLDTFKDFLERRKYWNQRKTGVDPVLFYTYVGDWFMDFGGGITFILICIASYCMTTYIRRKGSYNLLQLFMFFVYAKVLLQGWSINCFKLYGGMANLMIELILLYVMMKVCKVSDKNNRKFNILQK